MADNKENRNSLNEKLKLKEAEEALNNTVDENKPLALDDAQRVKVLSPARLVAKRFFRNKLAIIGLAILIFMFGSSFLGPLFYPYGQIDKFSTVNALDLDYAVCGELSSYTSFLLIENDVTKDVKNYIDSFVKEMEGEGVETKQFERNGNTFIVRKLGDRVYKLFLKGYEIAAIDPLTGDISSGDVSPEVAQKVKEAVLAEQGSFDLDGRTYTIIMKSKTKMQLFVLLPDEEAVSAILSTRFVINKLGQSEDIEDQMKLAIYEAIYGEREFEYNGAKYKIVSDEDDNLFVQNEAGENFLGIGHYSIRETDGKDTFTIDFKNTFSEVVDEMESKGERTGEFEYEVPQLNPETKAYNLDENGNIILEKEKLTVTRKEVAGEVRYYAGYHMRREVLDIYGAPSKEHILGTDGDGYDVLARIMYGGRISLIVGFIVVFLETIIGVIMGGIAGFFGGWVDTLIMRLVDIFYCIPTMPIMIIIASVFDELKMPPYERLIWMMVILGVLGWSGIARLVRGQILSLREQEFMVAAEATGLKTSRRIFKHLVPNVMPQLIVSMTMGLGGVILTESTLSYLGLGVKHPLATWGNIINSVSTIEAMKNYTYIWIPVGILICLTVIAFNFVGDGLRDAFDPKMKR